MTDHGHHHHADQQVASPAGLIGRLRPLITVLRPERRLLVITVVLGALNQLLTIAAAGLGALIVGRAVTGATAASLKAPAIVAIALIVPRALLPWLDSVLNHMMAFRVLVDLRSRVHHAFVRLAPGGLIDDRSGDLGARVIGDVELMETFFAHTLSPMIIAVTVPFVAIVLVGLCHWLLPIVLVPCLLLVASVPRWMQRRAAREGTALRAATANLSADLVDSVQGLREVIAFNHAGEQLRRIDAAGEQLHAAHRAHGRRSSFEQAAVDTGVSLGLLVVLVTAAVLVSTGRMHASTFPAAVVLAAFTFAPIANITEVARELNVVAAAADRIHALFARRAPVDEDDLPAIPLSTSRISFERVSFRYGEHLPDAVDDISFTIEPGETVALVGASGAGKSTAVHLLLRYWDPRSGSISIGGVDLRQLPQTTLRQTVTLVPQDVYLFHGSLRSNLLLGCPDATDDDLASAITTARADDIIEVLADGLDTIVGERGASLSGGQRQRIAIARALVRNSPILVLDEPVSNLDAETEEELREAMAASRVGRTVLVIAHRLSTILTADRIIMLEQGRIVAQGTHADLVAEQGPYRRLIESQLASGQRQRVFWDESGG